MAIQNMQIRATGRLFHHFHGVYSATVGLHFETAEDATLARPRLPGGAGAWMPVERAGAADPAVLVWRGDTAGLDALKGALAPLVEIEPCGHNHCRGQCRDASIDSLAHSVDCGPRFVLTVAAPHPGQVAFTWIENRIGVA